MYTLQHLHQLRTDIGSELTLIKSEQLLFRFSKWVAL